MTLILFVYQKFIFCHELFVLKLKRDFQFKILNHITYTNILLKKS